MILRALVLRPILREAMRTTLTILGIAVGVAVVVAIALLNQSALRAFRESVDAVAGRAHFMIVSGVGLSGGVLLKLQPFWAKGVRFAPVIDLEGMASVAPQPLPIRLLGVDLLSDLHFRDYRYASVVTSEHESAATYLSLFRDDSVVIPATFAHEHGLKLGSPLTPHLKGNPAEENIRGFR